MTDAVIEAGKPDARPDRLWLYALLSVVATAGFFYVNIMAAIVDGLITGLHFSNAEAGMVGSANIYGASVGALVAVFLVRRIAWRPALFSLLALLLGLDLLSTLIQTPQMLIAVRAVHGVIGGMAVGVSYSVIARTASPDRAFGMLLLVQFGLGGLGVMFLPGLVPDYGARILFLTLALFSACALVGTAMIPALAESRTDSRHGAEPRMNDGARATALLALLALFLFQAGNMSLSAFIIRLGEHFALGRGFIGQAIGWATWVGALGAVLVIVLGTHHGRFRPLVAAMMLTVIGTAGFFWSASGLVFFIANVATAITWSFVVPYLLGMLSLLDGSGRLATLGGFGSKLGLASGPMVAGWLLAHDDFDRLIGVALLTLAASGVATVLAAWRIDRLQGRQPGQ